MPDVVDSDEDAEDGGVEIEGVLLPAFLEVGDFVAADTAIVNAEAEVRVAAENAAAGEKGVSATEGGLVIGMSLVLFVASGVGDGITLEKNGVVFLKGGLGGRGLGGSGVEEGGPGSECRGADELASVERRRFHRVRWRLNTKHAEGGEAIVEGVHPDGNPEAAGFFAGEAHEDAKRENVADGDEGILEMECGPAEGGEKDGSPESKAGFAPTPVEDAPEHEFFDKGGCDSNTEIEENGKLRGVRHLGHGGIGASDAEMGGQEAEDERAADGDGSPKRPLPPFDFGLAQVFPAGPALTEMSNEPTKRADEEDGGEGENADDVAIHGNLHRYVHKIASF